MTVSEIADEIDVQNVVADHDRDVYWVPGDDTGEYPDVIGFANVPEPETAERS